MPIYRAILKYGYENFSFEILEYCAKEDCVKIETLYIANLKPAYNICQVGRSRLGIKHSLAMRAKISALHKGRIASEEVREKMRLAKAGENHPMFGKTLSEETKAKIGAAHTGKIISEETREKLRIARVGKTYPEETRAKMSMVKVGEKNPNFGQAISEETKAKMRAANGTPVYVLNTETGERNKYASGRETALVLFCNNATVARYLKSGKLFKGIYKISKCE